MAKERAKKRESSSSVAELECSFGTASTGKKSRRIGVSVPKSKLTPAQAEKFLCGKQIGGTITARANGGSGQASLPLADQDAQLTGVFEVKSYSSTPDRYSFGMAFVRSSLSDGALDPFVNKAGVLVIEDVSKIPEPEDGAEGGEGDDEDGEE